MLANFFEGVKNHDRSELGKNVYKKGDLAGGCSPPGVRHHWCKLAWSSLYYQYEAVDITGRLAIHQEGGH